MWNYTDIANIRKHIKNPKFSMQFLSLITVIIIFQAISPCTSLISDKRLCYDPDCSEAVSIGKTIIKYHASESDILSFDLNADVKVFSKSAGSREDLWGVEINGKRGYIPKRFIREKKVLHSDLNFTVPTDVSFKKPIQTSDRSIEVKDHTSSTINSNLINNDNETELPPNIDQVSPSFEVIDGTTIPFPSETEEKENSYATKIIHQSSNIQEQPTLSVHPNLKPSEIPPDTASTVKTGDLSESNKESEKSTASHSTKTVEKKNTDIKDSSDGKVSETVLLETSSATSEKQVEKPKPETIAVESVLNFPKNDKENKETEKLPKENEEMNELDKDVEGFDDEDEDKDNDDDDDDGDDDDDDNEDMPVEMLDKAENDIQSSDQKLSKESVETKSEAIENETVTSTLANVLGKVTSYFASPDSKPSAEEDLQEEKVASHEENEKNPETIIATDIKLSEITETPSAIITEPESKESQSVEVGKQVSDEKETLSLEITEEIAEKTNITTEIPLETVPANKIPSEEIRNTVETEAMTEKVPEQVTALPDVTENNLPVNETLKEIEQVSEVAEEVPESTVSVPIAKVKKFSPPVDSEEIKMSTELPNFKVPEKLQEVVEPSIDENIEEASGTTETSVQLDLTDQTIEQVSESLSVDSTTQATQQVVYNDSVVFEDVNTLSKVNIIIDNDKLNDTQDVTPKTEEEPTQQGQPGINEEDGLSGLSHNTYTDRYPSFNEFPSSRNLLNVQSEVYPDSSELLDINKSEASYSDTTTVPEDKETTTISSNVETITSSTEAPRTYQEVEINKDELVGNVEHVILPPEVCSAHNNCDESIEKKLPGEDDSTFNDEKRVIHAIEQGQNYWETLSYLTLTALTTLLFSLGYFYIENTRRDGQLIAKINKLEKELLISTKECTALDETLKSTKTKLGSIEDESFGSNEIVTSLKVELEDTNKAKVDLENQVSTLEKDLESATEAGLELERMLRELLATKNEENPLAKTIEDLQARLDAQKSANKSLTSALQLKTQELEIDKSENDSLRNELAVNVQKCGQLELEVTRLSEELNSMTLRKQDLDIQLTQQVEELEKHLTDITNQHKTLKIQLKSKEMEIKDLSEVVKKSDVNSIDLAKLSNISQMKAEIDQLKEERDDLKIKLTEIEGAHNLLEEHSKSINKEIMSLTDQVKVAIKEKNEAETRLEVLTKFFQEKEAERQKEENLWLQKQGEVSTTVEKMQIMQSEIQNYKQQIETLKREILDQEKEYKTQIAALEAKAHEQWVRARKNERRLEESKAESGQLRNRLTLIEKNISDNESEAKTHRLESNGETATSPQLFLGAETSSSPLMFTGSSSIPPPPYLYGPPLPFLSSHLPTLSGYDVGQRPPPLGRLSSPPPIPITASGPLPPPPPLHTSSNSRYDHSGSSPSPPISPSLMPHPHGPYRSNAPPPPPIPPFSNDRIPPVPLPGMLPPPHLSSTAWGEEKLSSRNNGSFHPFQRDQHPREYKGSLGVSEESVERSRRSGKL